MGVKAYLPATADFCSVGVIVEVVIISMPTLPLAKALRASPVFHAIELGSTILYLVAQSNQNWTACTACGVFICAVLRSCEMKLPPICSANIHQIFQGSNESEGSISAPYTPAEAFVIFWASWTNSVQVVGAVVIPAFWNSSLL